MLPRHFGFVFMFGPSCLGIWRSHCQHGTRYAYATRTYNERRA
jgi:hypothetical protein